MMVTKNEKDVRTLAMLRYQAGRYQAMGKGSMSQQLNAKIRRLMNELSSNAVHN